MKAIGVQPTRRYLFIEKFISILNSHGRDFHWTHKTGINRELQCSLENEPGANFSDCFVFPFLIRQSCQLQQKKSMDSGWNFFFFISRVWAGHNLYHSGLLKLVQEDFILQACLTGILLARWVQLCIQLRFIFYVCVKTPAMNLAAQTFTFILYSSGPSLAHFHRLSLRVAPGWAERTKAKNRSRNSGA